MKKVVFLVILLNVFVFGDITNPKTCFVCHNEQYQDWQTSLHSQSHEDSDELYKLALEYVSNHEHKPYEAVVLQCATCHNPKIEKKIMDDDTTLAAILNVETAQKTALQQAMEADHIKTGVSCYICHNVDSIKQRNNNLENGYKLLNWTVGNTIVGPYDLSSNKAVFHETQQRDFLKNTNNLCLTCHQGQANDNEFSTYTTGDEMGQSSEKCIECHMGDVKKDYIAPQIKRDNMKAVELRSHIFAGARNENILKTAIDLGFQKEGNKAIVYVTNKLPHGVPTGFSGRDLILKARFFNGEKSMTTENYEFKATYNDSFGSETLSYVAKSLASDTRLKPNEERAIEFNVPDGATSVEVEVVYYILSPTLQKTLNVTNEKYKKSMSLVIKKFNL